MSAKGSSRRELLKVAAAAGGGLALGVALPPARQRAAARDGAAAQIADPELAAFIVVHPDDRVVVRIARAELGQGTSTGLAQLVAEELDCDWSKVSVEWVAPGRSLARNRIWRDFVTSASRGIRASQDYMRLAGASARHMLLEAAADLWKVPFAELKVEKGIVSHSATGRSASYGHLAPLAARRKIPDPRLVKLSEPEDWRLAGKPLRPLDLATKLDGRHVFGIDLRLPGMLCAALKDSAVPGARLLGIDDAAALRMPGVRRVVRVGPSAIAVVAESWWQAKTALDVVAATWDEGSEPNLSSEAIFEQLKEGLEAPQAFIGTAHGDALKAIRGAAKRIEAVYSMPFAHQATLEPMTATARWTPERVEVWTATQNAEAAQKAAAEAAGLPPERAEIHRLPAGGSFGRRIRSDFITQAVLIAREVPGTPVKLIWSREHDTRHGYYRPASMAKLTGGLDEKGEITGLIMRISCPSIAAATAGPGRQQGRDARVFQGLYGEAGEAQIGYSLPNLYIDHAMRNTRVPVGSWRGVYSNQNALFLECFIDELAVAAGRDPLDFRRSLMRSHNKHLVALTAVASKADWGRPRAPGRFQGIAQAMAYGSYAAAVAEVSVSDGGRLHVHRIVVALDCGRVVNPDLVNAQVEGCVAFGLGSLLHQEITIRDGRVIEANFDTYGVLRIAEMPQVEVVQIPSDGFWGGVGEAAIGVVAPAVLNAIFAATGKRVRTLPLRNVRLR